MMLLYSHLLEWNNQYPKSELVRYKNKSYSVSDIYFEVETISRAIYNLKGESGKPIILFLKNPIDTAISYLACNRLNITSVIINPSWKYPEISGAIKNIEVNFILSDWDCSKILKDEEIGIEVCCIEEIIDSSRGCGIKSDPEVISNSTECILFTSGTTGNPKAVELTSDNFIESVRIWNKEIEFSENDNYVLCLSLHHISGLSILYRSMLNHFKITLLDSLDDLGDIDTDPNLISIVPTMLRDVFNSNNLLSKMRSMRAVILGGEMVDGDVVKECLDYELKIFISYGLTETCSGICGYWVTKDSYIEGSSGKAFDGTKIEINNNGNIMVSSGVVMKGYWGNSIDDKKIITNDLGCIKDGYLFIEGRSDNSIVSGGENIDIKEVEGILMSHPKVLNVNIRVSSHTKWGQCLIADLTAEPLLTSEDIRVWCKGKISSYKIPYEINISNKMKH